MKPEKEWDKTHQPEDYLNNYMRTKPKARYSDAVYALVITAILAFLSLLGLYYFGVFN